MRTRRRHAAGALLCALLLAEATPALAQTADVQTLLREGFAARRAQRDADALRSFEAAWALDRSASTLAQVALAEQALGRWVDAERHLLEALAAADPWIARNTPTLRAALVAVREHLGSLSLEGRPVGATVLVDDRPAGTLPLPAPLRVPVGTVVIRVTAPGHHPLERPVVVAARATLREEVSLVAETPRPEPVVAAPVVAPIAAPVAQPPPPPPVVTETHRPVAPWVVVGAGAAVLAGAVVFSVLRGDAVSSLRARCGAADDPSTEAVECAPDADARDLHESAGLYRDLSIVALSVGGAAVVAGLVWRLVSPSHRTVTVGAARGGFGLAWSF